MWKPRNLHRQRIAEVFVVGDRLWAAHGHLGADMVVQIGAHAFQVQNRGDAQGLQLIRGAYAGQQQQLRGLEGAGAADHLAAGVCALQLATLKILDAYGTSALEQNAGGMRLGEHL